MIESSTSLMNCLRYIYGQVESCCFLPDYDPHVEKVSRVLNLDSTSSLIFSYLFFQEDKFTTSSFLCSFVFHPLNIHSALREMVSRGVLDIEKSSTGFSYRVSEKYRHSVQEGMMEMDEEDIVKLMAKTPRSKVLSESWQDALLGRIYRQESNKRFVAGFKSVGYDTMCRDARTCLWNLLLHFIVNFDAEVSCEENELMPSITTQGMSELVSRGIAVVCAKDSSESNLRYQISPSTVNLFFHGREDLIRYDSLSNEADLIRWEDIEEKELYFSQGCQTDIDHLKFILSRDGFERAQGIFEKLKRKHAVTSLFWGPPGTGKTEVIKQLARQSGRNILLMDAAKLTATGWGETEKLYRRVFSSYKYLAALSSNVPVLLFNEADQFLGKRLCNLERAIDKSENVVSNIILQNLEDFEGILMATTNLVENIDSAFDRRFIFKIKLDKPNALARKKIWSFYIPELTQEEVEHLADDFELTGSEIYNIATKRALAELYETGDRGYDYIVNLCLREGLPLLGRSQSERKRVGF